MSEVQQRARQAKELLENETFKAVLDLLTERTIGDIRHSAAGDTLRREAAASNLRGLDAIRAQLEGWISDAVVEKGQIERAERRAKAR